MYGLELEFWDFLFEKGKRDLKIYSLKTAMVFLSQAELCLLVKILGALFGLEVLSGLYSYNLYTGAFVHHQEKALREQYIDSKNIRKYWWIMRITSGLVQGLDCLKYPILKLNLKLNPTMR